MLIYLQRVALTGFIFLCLLSIISVDKKYDQIVNSTSQNIHDGNEVHTSFTNIGNVSNSSRINDFTWPEQNPVGYLSEISFFVAAEVSDTAGNIRHIVSEHSNDQGDYNFSWQALPGYANQTEHKVAMSDDPISWPSSWTEWPGIHQAGETIATQESFYVMNDNPNSEFGYYPNPSDSSKRGLGVTVKVRGFQWNTEATKNFLLFNYRIINTGEKALDSMMAGLYGAPHIGGTDDYYDDFTSFTDANGLDNFTGELSTTPNLLYSWDADSNGVSHILPGYLGIGLLQNSASLHLGGCKAMAYNDRIVPMNDEAFWDLFNSANNYYMNQATDNVIYLGTNIFTLQPGDSIDLGIVYALGRDKKSLFENVNNAQVAYAQIQVVDTPQVELTSTFDSEIEGSKIIEWSSSIENSTVDHVDLYYTLNRGDVWTLLASDLPPTSSYNWQTDNYPDGYNYQIRAVAKTGTSIGRATSHYFSVNNSGNTDFTDLVMLTSFVADTLSGVVPIQWRAGDADGDPVSVTVLVSNDQGRHWEVIDSVQNGNNYQWNTTKMANGPEYQLKLMATNGITFNQTLRTRLFAIYNSFPTIPDSGIVHAQGDAEGVFQVQVTDRSSTTGDVYKVTFNDFDLNNVTYNVLDTTTNQLVLENVDQLTSEESGPEFDGLRLLLQDVPMGEYDSVLTGWSSGNCNLGYRLEPMSVQPPIDYQIEFLNSASNMDILFHPANFVITNLETNDEVDFQFSDSNHDGFLTIFETVLIRYTPELGTPASAWRLIFTRPESGEPTSPQEGDVFQIITRKRFSAQDVYYIKSPAPTTVGDEIFLPEQFALYQNYPNPLNPTTTISYNLPGNSAVDLTVFNLKGQLVKTLTHQVLKKGKHNVRWNGTNDANIRVASGIYFYRLQTEFGVKLKRMILLR